MTGSHRTVALLIDYDNLQICFSRDAPGTQLDLTAVVTMAQTYGRLVVARAYAEWNLLSERLAVYKAGIDPSFAPVLRAEGSNREGKSLADTVMVSEGVDILWTYDPDVLVLVTSDKDMVPLARIAKQRGVLVVVLGSDLTAVQLLEMANEFVTYRHLLREMGRSEEPAILHQARDERPHRGSPREVAAAREATIREPRTVPRRRGARIEQPSALPPQATTGGRPIITPPSIERPAPAVVLGGESSATGDEGQVGPGAPGGLEEELPSVAPRRRRRRGGRGRRTGVVGADGEMLTAAGQADDGGDGNQTDEGGAETAASDDVGPPALPVSAGEVNVHVAPADLAEPRAEEAGPPSPTNVDESRTQTSGAEATSLKPWERWPEAPPAPPAPVRAARRERRPSPPPAAPTGEALSTPPKLEVPGADTKPGNGASESSTDVTAETAATSSETDAVSPAVSPASPPRRRRTRRPAARSSAEAPAATVEPE